MRQAINVLVFPYYMDENKKIKYAVFKRTDSDMYQAISGGVEDDETLLEAAKRESFEEAGITFGEFIKLDASASIPGYMFNEYNEWGKDVYLVTEKTFGLKVIENEFKLSHEHESYDWYDYESALKVLTWDSNKVALWELNERLKEKHYKK